MKLVELLIEDLDEEFVDAVSFVEMPAIETDFQFFNNDKNKFIFAKTDIEKRIVSGPAMIPDKKIFRVDQFTGEEYEVFFSKETLEKIVVDYFEKNRHKHTTVDHESQVNDTFIFESWLIKDKDNDKSKSLGYDLPDGTWMISMKVNNDELWERIKNGEVKGFSIEGYFADKIVKNEKQLSDSEKAELIKKTIYSEDSDVDKELKIKKILGL